MGTENQYIGSGEADPPAGVDLLAGGSDGSDYALQGEIPRERGDADKPSESSLPGGRGGDVGEEGKTSTKEVVLVLYTEKGKKPVRMELRGDPFEVCEQVSARMFPGVKAALVDEKFNAIMQKRKEDERRAK